MIFPTAMMIGFAAGLTRSAIGIVIAAALVGLTFALAVMVSPGPVAWPSLAWAYAGFNSGLIALLLGLVAIERRKTA
jgi:hypothetical protein